MGLLYKIIMYLISLYNEKMSDKKKTKPKKEKDIISNMVYLLTERNRAIAEIERVQKATSPEMIEWERCKKLWKQRYAVTNPDDGSLYIPDENVWMYRRKTRRFLRNKSETRAAKIDKKFAKNIERCIESLEENLSKTGRRLELQISSLKKNLESLVDDICRLTRDQFLGSTKCIREDASERIAILTREVEDKMKSIEASEQELLTLSEEELKALEKARSRRKEMGNTLESFISYLELLKKRSDYEKFEDSLKIYLSYFDTNQCCIRQIEKFLDGTDGDLGKLSEVVENNRSNCMCASFDVLTKMVTLVLNNFDRHVIDLPSYLHHLKEETRKSDIKRLEKHIGEISSTRTGWIERLRCLDPRVEEDLPKIRDAVKLDWCASFDVSTQMVCLTNPDEKVGHLSIPEYLEYLNDKLCEYEEILSEKKRACGLLCFYTKECSICIDSDRTEKWSILNCGHKFHTSCISKWRPSTNKCPTCRTEISTCIIQS
jgi:hypothetical protein